MEVTTLKADERVLIGTNNVKRLRDAGKVPAVIYGGNGAPVHVELEGREVERELREHHRVFQLDVAGQTESVYLQAVQFDVLTDLARHIDFMRIDVDKPLEVLVELAFIGHPVGVPKGGVLIRDRTKLPVKAKPLAVPYEIEVPTGDVDLGDTVVAGDFELPHGVHLDCPLDTIVCHMPGEVRVFAEPLEEATPEATPEGAADDAPSTPDGKSS